MGSHLHDCQKEGGACQAARSCRERIKELSAATILSRYTIARFLPAIGRFLIVVTFLEDALRIVTQWNDQLHYLQDFRGSKCWPCHS